MWIVWPFRKKNFGSAWTVCADFNRYVDPHAGQFVIRDENDLPHPKRVIFESMCILLMAETNKTTLDLIKSDAFELAFYQKDVGAEPLHPHGINMDGDDTFEPGTLRTAMTNPAGKEKYDRFKRLRDAEWERMRATMAKVGPRAVA